MTTINTTNAINNHATRAAKPTPSTSPLDSKSIVDGFDMGATNHPNASSRAATKSLEQNFIEALHLPSYGIIAKQFIETYANSDNSNYQNIDDLLIKPTADADMPPRVKNFPYHKDTAKLESWHENIAYQFAGELFDADDKTRQRHIKRDKEGLGITGSFSQKNIAVKEAAYFAKNNLTVRGNIVKATNEMCGQTIFELLPLYASRKGPKISIILSEKVINTFLSATGTALIPVTFGISKVVTNQLGTVVTLSGEAVMGKVLGASNTKVATYAALRGVQLELPAVTPVGKAVACYETVVDTGCGLTIAASSIADLVLNNMSTRYASVVSSVDLGDEAVLAMINQRIDYLARFLVPYGQYLYLRSNNAETKSKLRYILAEQFKVLRKLEQAKTRALHFYQLAILAERLPASRASDVEDAVRNSVPDTRKNSHRLVRRCLATLLREHPLTTTQSCNDPGSKQHASH